MEAFKGKYEVLTNERVNSFPRQEQITVAVMRTVEPAFPVAVAGSEPSLGTMIATSFHGLYSYAENIWRYRSVSRVARDWKEFEGRYSRGSSSGCRLQLAWMLRFVLNAVNEVIQCNSSVNIKCTGFLDCVHRPEGLFSSYLESRAMDRVQKPKDSDCYHHQNSLEFV
jgi:hypothetical protein